MKKFFLVLSLFLGTFLVNADNVICKISGENDSVEIFDYQYDEKERVVNVTVGNDSQNISASVTVEVEVTYTNNNKKIFKGKDIAKPNCTSIIKVRVEDTYNNAGKYPIKSVIAKSIGGTKCM